MSRFFAAFTNDVDINIKDLRFRNTYRKENEKYILSPGNPAAAAPLYKDFPPDKYEYTFYVFHKDDEETEDCCYMLFIKVHSGPLDERYFRPGKTSIEDYEYLRRFFKKIFPETYFPTVKERKRQLIEDMLWEPSFLDTPSTNVVQDFLEENDAFNTFFKYFCKKADSFDNASSADIDFCAFDDFFLKELFSALLDKIKREKKEK